MKPKLSVREMLQEKKHKTREREENFQKKFAVVPQCVQEEYLRCETQINSFAKFLDECMLWDKPIQKFEQVFYTPGKGNLTETQIVQLHELLRFKYKGWNIMLTAPAKWHGNSPRPIGLLFRYIPED